MQDSNNSIPINVLTFEELRTVQKRGQTNDSLQNLGPDFLNRVSDYLKLKKSLSDRLSTKEYENAVRVISNILELRERKLVRLAALAARTKIPIKNISDSEKEFLNSLKTLFEKHHKSIDTKIGLIRGVANEQELKELQEETQEFTEKKVELEEQDIKKPSLTEKRTLTVDEKQIKEKEDIKSKEIEVTMKKSVENTEELLPEEKITKTEPIIATTENNKPENTNQPITPRQLKQTEEITENNQPILSQKIKPEKDQGVSKDKIENQMHKIRIKSMVPKFLGVNLEVYGPFNAGDEIELPPKNAEVLINQGIAEAVKSPILGT